MRVAHSHVFCDRLSVGRVFLERLRPKFPVAQSHTAPRVNTKKKHWVASSWLSNSNLIGGLYQMNFMLSKPQLNPPVRFP